MRFELLKDGLMRVEQVGVGRILDCGCERAREKVVPRLGKLERCEVSSAEKPKSNIQGIEKRILRVPRREQSISRRREQTHE